MIAVLQITKALKDLQNLGDKSMSWQGQYQFNQHVSSNQWYYLSFLPKSEIFVSAAIPNA